MPEKSWIKPDHPNSSKFKVWKSGPKFDGWSPLITMSCSHGEPHEIGPRALTTIPPEGVLRKQCQQQRVTEFDWRGTKINWMACSILFLWVKGTIIGFYQQNWIGKFTGHFNPMNGVSDQPKQSLKKSMWVFHDQKTVFTSEDLLVLNVGNGWVAGGCWGDYY